MRKAESPLCVASLKVTSYVGSFVGEIGIILLGVAALSRVKAICVIEFAVTPMAFGVVQLPSAFGPKAR